MGRTCHGELHWESASYPTLQAFLPTTPFCVSLSQKPCHPESELQRALQSTAPVECPWACSNRPFQRVM